MRLLIPAISLIVMITMVPFWGFATTRVVTQVKAEAAEGNVKAMVELAYWYSSGIYVEKDEAKSFYWFEKAARMGHPEGISNMCYAYYRGSGVQKDFKQALSFCTKAANTGHLNSILILSEMYTNGEGVPKDPAKGAAWTEKAAKQGHVVSQYLTGKNYENGTGVKKDRKKAHNWYQLAAKHGSKQADQRLKEWDEGSTETGKEAVSGQGETKQYRVGPIVLDAPATFSSHISKENKNLVLRYQRGGTVQGKYGSGYPTLVINAERKRKKTLESYLDEKYIPLKSYYAMTPPEKLGEGVYAFYAGDDKIVVMQLAGTDILVWMQIGFETDEINQIIATIRSAE